MFKIAGMVLALASLAGCTVAGKQESPVLVVNDGTKSSEMPPLQVQSLIGLHTKLI